MKNGAYHAYPDRPELLSFSGNEEQAVDRGGEPAGSEACRKPALNHFDAHRRLNLSACLRPSPALIPSDRSFCRTYIACRPLDEAQDSARDGFQPTLVTERKPAAWQAVRGRVRCQSPSGGLPAGSGIRTGRMVAGSRSQPRSIGAVCLAFHAPVATEFAIFTNDFDPALQFDIAAG